MMRARLLVAALVPTLVGCYLNRPLLGPPEPSMRVAMMLTDVGRAEEANRLGPGTFRVEGSVVATTDTAFLLSVSGVQPIRGAFVPWAGETVSVQRSHVAQAYERRLSPARTAIATGGAVGVVVAAIVTAKLFGFGRDEIPIVPPPDDPPPAARIGGPLTSNLIR